MSWTWWVWLVGGAVLLCAGFAAAYVPRERARRRAVRVAWSAARAAIGRAEVSRDAASATVPEAERLLSDAEHLLAEGGGRAVARGAETRAAKADRLWREAADG
ncbi:DUF6403 family protein [Saccharomonospora azurea]|uniref:DUF6403 family protein n=1 Tax=Saccharomonospora azurea TaxID=40988 RepID=UPI00023FEDAD|nr:DUF6403 family protein [Saccharomonospora azurea]EHK80144.1 hypothetical protein SZMC14600_23355 [Saccharomonospora azurea SZMC 14600]EHK86590.1 hypothetical protein SZMC14600_14460 [Saccharomonospora azurea SZMC 14600]